MSKREVGVQAVRRVLRPVRNGASQALYGNAKRYKLRLDGRRTVFSTEQPVAHQRHALHERVVLVRHLVLPAAGAQGPHATLPAHPPPRDPRGQAAQRRANPAPRSLAQHFLESPAATRT